MERKNVFLSIVIVMLVSSCTPINMLTRFKKTPRQYIENYDVNDVLAPRGILNSTPWIVYAERSITSSVNPGGMIKLKDIEMGDAMFVIGEKEYYLEVVKYSKENIKDKKFVEKGSAEYLGWIDRRDVILSSSALTKTITGHKYRYIVGFGDTTTLFNPQVYFASASELKLFSDPQLKKTNSSIGVGEIVYLLKQNDNNNSYLISNSPYIEAEKSKKQILGWISSDVVHNIGERFFADYKDFVDKEISSLKYHPMVDSKLTDSVSKFSTGKFIPVIDKSYNNIYNVDGKEITYVESENIKKELRKIDIIFVFEAGKMLREQYPMFINSIANVQNVFNDSLFVYRYGAVIATKDNVKSIKLTSSFDVLINELVKIDVSTLNFNVISGWKALRRSFELFDGSDVGTNIIINIGEQGTRSEEAPSDIKTQLKRKNIRLLGWQTFSSKLTRYNNYILQLSDMITSSADYYLNKKRDITLYAEQLSSDNRFMGLPNNHFMLDYPNNSVCQGGFIFPEKDKTLSLSLFTSVIDSLVKQVEEDNMLLITSFDRAFQNMNNSKDRYTNELIHKYNIPTLKRPAEDLYKFYRDSVQPYTFSATENVELSDSLYNMYLLLSSKEVERMKLLLATLAEKQVDFVSNSKRDHGKTITLAKYLKEYEDQSTNSNILLSDFNNVDQEVSDSTYISTRNIRKYLYKTYIKTFSNMRYTVLSKRQWKKLPLSEIHKYIFDAPSNNIILDNIKLNMIKRSSKLSDEELALFLKYLEERSMEFDVKSSEEQIKIGEDTYSYIKQSILP